MRVEAVVLLALAALIYALKAKAENFTMSKVIEDLTASVTDLEAHAAAVNAERSALAAEVAALKALPPPAPVLDEAELAALTNRVDAVSASLVAPVVAAAPAADPVIVVEAAPEKA